MDDLIKRQDAIGKIKDWMKFIGYSHSERNVMLCTIQMLEELPSAEPRQKTGKWIAGREIGRTMLGNCIIEILYDGWTCSECHCLYEKSTKPTYKFCPNCGARMENES